MVDHQLFGGAQNEGDPNEMLVEGSDFTRTSAILRNSREERSGQPTAEENLLRENTHAERVRVLQFNLTSHLVSSRWPELMLIRTRLSQQLESDFQLYPEFGRFSPWFPRYMQNDISQMEFEGDDNIAPGVVLKWCNRHFDQMAMLELDFHVGDTLNRVAVRI